MGAINHLLNGMTLQVGNLEKTKNVHGCCFSNVLNGLLFGNMGILHSNPKASMYGIFTYIYHILPWKKQLNVGKYTSPMDSMG